MLYTSNFTSLLQLIVHNESDIKKIILPFVPLTVSTNNINYLAIQIYGSEEKNYFEINQ